jgi:hypothetical protein
MMDYKDHLFGVGAIVTNLQALETSLRYFLVRRFEQHFRFPMKGEPTACKNYLTAFASLGELIGEYNKSLKPDEEKFKIDFDAVRIRDALAHGRLVLPEPPAWPATLWKFGKVEGGRMPVEFCQELTVEWMKEQYLKMEEHCNGLLHQPWIQGSGATTSQRMNRL